MERCEEPSWFVDADVVWLRSPVDVLGPLPPEACAHAFCTSARPPCKAGLTALQFERECATKCLARPRDGLYVQPPFRLPPGSPFARAVLDVVASFWPPLFDGVGPCNAGRPWARFLHGPASRRNAAVNYQVIMDALEASIAAFGLEFACFD
eukprot:7405517-Alexandrium_andersonii.AAC.1